MLVAILILASFSKIYAAAPTYEPPPTASQVLVVYNSSYVTDSDSDGTQDSLEVANYYKNKRSIPSANILGIAAPTTEEITRTQYDTQIKPAIESYLTSSGLKDSIKYIVLVKGIPLKIQATNGTSYGTTNYSSVDAAVCLLYQTYDTTWTLSNPYFNVDPSYTKNYRFKTNYFSNNGVYLKYLVTRLDGYTMANIKGMIDRDFIADTSGNGYWILDNYTNEPYTYMQTASNYLRNLRQNVNPNPWSTSAMITRNPAGPVIGYTSNGIHAGMGDGYVSNIPSNPNHLNFTLLPGAVFSTYESFNAYGFVNENQSTQGQVAEWIEIGGSGGIGNVYEPWSSNIANEEIFMPEYAVGYPWADAAYQSLVNMDFVSVVVGDPLMIIRDTTPPAEVTNLQATTGNAQVSLSWTNPGDADFAGVEILRKTGSYSANVTDGTVVYNNNGNSYTDTGLINNTTYYYTAFAYDQVPNYSAGSASGARATVITSSIIISDVVPPGKPKNFNASAGNTQISLSWTNPTDTDFVGVKILRRTDYYPISPTNGTLVYRGAGTSYVNTGLQNGTTYFYTIFAFDRVNNFSLTDYTVNAPATPYSGSPISNASPVNPPSITFTEPNVTRSNNISGMSAQVSSGSISLSWTNPFNDKDWKGTRLLRKTGSYPNSETDGKIIYNGLNSGFTDTSVSPGTTYYYAAFAYNNSRNYSDGTVSGAKTSALAQ